MRMEEHQSKTRTVHSAVMCVDTLLQIAGRKFLGVPKSRCEIQEDCEVEIVDGPIVVKDADGEFTEVVKVRHLNEREALHEGWIPYSFVK